MEAVVGAPKLVKAFVVFVLPNPKLPKDGVPVVPVVVDGVVLPNVPNDGVVVDVPKLPKETVGLAPKGLLALVAVFVAV